MLAIGSLLNRYDSEDEGNLSLYEDFIIYEKLLYLELEIIK